MNAVLVANWNAVVGPHDTVHVLGDVAMGRREQSMPLIGRLAGHKILYPGNHDRCWYGHGERALRLEQEHLDAGFDEIRQGPIVITVGNREVLVCHLPHQGDSGESERYREFRRSTRECGCSTGTCMRGGASKDAWSTSVWMSGTSRRSPRK